jgi:archaeosine-15-forming tRNA-guanine transglycosylase
MTTAINISKKIQQGEEVVVVKKTDYLHLLEQITETRSALQAIRQGESAHKKGKTRVVTSLKELITP